MSVCVRPCCDHSIVLRMSFPGLHSWYAGWYIMTWHIDGDLLVGDLVEHTQFSCCPSLL